MLRIPHVHRPRLLPRRAFLRGAGTLFALPFLDAMRPAFAGNKSVAPEPRRLLALCNNLGILPEPFFPKPGFGLQSPYLNLLQSHEGRFTVFSGLSHPGVDGSHASDVSFLTAAPHPAGGGFRNSLSLDQYVAGEIGIQTRFPSLSLGVNAKAGRRGLSWTASGVLIPCENSPAAVYARLFLQGSSNEVEQRVRKLALGGSIMDTLAGQSRALRRRLGARDLERLDQYETSVREVERGLQRAQEWERLPKPKVAEPMPEDPGSNAAFLERTRLMLQMARLAFETDSTRAISLLLDANNSPAIQVRGTEITDGYHNLSHHGMNPGKLAQLEAIDRHQFSLLNDFLTGLASTPVTGGSLLDHTLVLYGSNFGDANRHTTDNLPILLAGGKLRHAGYLEFDRVRNHPLPNLFVTMLQSMGFETESFASSTGTLPGLDLA